MKKNKKICLFSLVFLGVILIIVGVILFAGTDNEESPVVDNPDNQQQEKPPKDDSNHDIIYSSTEKKENKDIEITNFKYAKKDAGFIITFDVANNSKKEYDNLVVSLYLYDNNKVFLYDLYLHLGPLESGKQMNVERILYYDFSNVADYDFVVHNR